MFEAPMENESGGQPGNSGRTDSQVSVMVLHLVLSINSICRAKGRGC